MDELKKVIEALGRAFEEFKKGNDERIKQLESKGSADPTITAKVDKANADIQKLTEEKSKLETELKAVQTAMNRPGADQGDGKAKGDSAEYKKAFDRYMRKGVGTAEELKALSNDSDPDGGYLVRPEVSSSIIKQIYETSPLRALCMVQTIGSDKLQLMSDLGQASSGWVAERASRPSTGTPQLKLIEITAQELYAEPVATQRQLDDSAWDMEAWLAAKVAEKFGRDENTAFVAGTGQGQPRGFLTYANGTSNFGQIEQVTTGSAGNVTADAILKLFYTLKEGYQKNATWGMARLTLLAVRQLKDSQNRYLWQPDLKGGNPDTLVGRPIVQMSDMQAMASASLSVVCGDFKQAYQIVDRVGIRTLRDPFTSKGNVIFYTTKRVGGDVVNFEALKILKLS